MEISELYKLFRERNKVSTDSRKITGGEIYFSLKGERFNGNTYAAQALEAGAAYAIIDEPAFKLDDPRYILVEDGLECLQELSTYHRKALGIPIFAITGSNGKTTTKELIHAVLSTSYKTQATLGNLNNHIGVPLTLLSIRKDTQMAIVEMGANHPYEINQLCKHALPNFGLITNIGKAHLEGFGGIDGVMAAKGELFEFLEHSGGKLFVNSNDERVAKLAYWAPSVWTYGSNKFCKTHVESLGAKPFLHLRWYPRKNKKTGEQPAPLTIESSLIGEYNLDNIIAAIAVGDFFGVKPAMIKKGIESYVPSNKRSQVLKLDNKQFILDCYNANPSSMRAAIANFVQMTAPKKMLILGDMLELGADSAIEHTAILDQLKQIGFDQVLLVGEEFKAVAGNYDFKTFSDVQTLKAQLDWNSYNEFHVLVKGSRGIALEKVLPEVVE